MKFFKHISFFPFQVGIKKKKKNNSAHGMMIMK